MRKHGCCDFFSAKVSDVLCVYDRLPSLPVARHQRRLQLCSRLLFVNSRGAVGMKGLGGGWDG